MIASVDTHPKGGDAVAAPFMQRRRLMTTYERWFFRLIASGVLLAIFCTATSCTITNVSADNAKAQIAQTCIKSGGTWGGSECTRDNAAARKALRDML